MSDYNECNQCGGEIESSGVQFRGKSFCSDECCEKFEQEFLDKDEPVIDELEDEEDVVLSSLDEDLEGGLDFEEDDDEDNLLDDDYDISPDDF